MKQTGLLLCILVMVSLLSGCSGVQEPVETTGPEAVTVSNVDELLAALAPETQIVMEPGNYNLSWASDFGRETDSKYYRWEEAADGYELTVQGVHNLTIRGSGMEETTILAGPRYANVLTLKNCSDVVLEDFTAGHTDSGACAGGVINLLGSSDVTMNRLGLFGCGTMGIQAELCTRIRASECDIYDCSSYGIWTSRTDGMTVENCTLRELGGQSYGNGGAVACFHDTGDVLISGCQITDNRVTYLIVGEPRKGLEVRDTAFLRNRVDLAAFGVNEGGMVLDGCTFEGNTMEDWFSVPGTTVIDGIGKTWDEHMLNLHYNGVAEEPTAGEQASVTVSNVDELLAAIAPDTEILLKDGTYDLSTASDYGQGYSDYYYWLEEYDGPVLVIDGVNNLTIRSESGDVTKCTISAVPRYANIFNFRKCSNLTLSGFTAGHTIEPGECMGGVLDFERCSTVLVENCGLFGCGILGVQARLGRDLSVKACEIYECSYGGIQMSDMVGVVIEDCTFRDLGGNALYCYACEDVTVDGEHISAYEYYG